MKRPKEELWDWIKLHKSDEQLSEEFVEVQGEINKLEEIRADLVEKRRMSLSKDKNGTWLSILQPHLLKLMRSAREKQNLKKQQNKYQQEPTHREVWNMDTDADEVRVQHMHSILEPIKGTKKKSFRTSRP